jgi:hypothetical protein
VTPITHLASGISKSALQDVIADSLRKLSVPSDACNSLGLGGKKALKISLSRGVLVLLLEVKCPKPFTWPHARYQFEGRHRS